MQRPSVCGECQSFLHSPQTISPYSGSCSYWESRRASGYTSGFCTVNARMSACTQGLMASPERIIRVKKASKVAGVKKTPLDKVKELLKKLSPEELRNVLRD